MKKREFDQIEKRDVEDKGLIERAAFSALMVGASVDTRGNTILFGLATEVASLNFGLDVDWLDL